MIVPSLNQGQYIEATLRSILGQGYPRLQLIVMDGGSSDCTVDVLRHYEKCLSEWVSEPDEGQADAINKGLRRAEGEIIQWINADDYLAPDALWRVAEAFGGADGGEIHAVAGVTENFFDEERFSYPVTCTKLSSRNLICEPLGSGARWHQPSIWLRTQALRDIGGVLDNFDYFFDLHMLIRYFHRFPRIRYIDDTLVKFRLHTGSKSGTGRLNFVRERVKVMESLLQQSEFSDLHEDIERAREALVWEVFCTRTLYDRERSRWVRAYEILMRATGGRGYLQSKMTRKTIRRVLLRGGPKESPFESLYQHPPPRGYWQQRGAKKYPGRR